MTPPRTKKRIRVGLWLVVIASLVLLRYRGRVAWVLSLHEWLAERGVPAWARNLDNDVLLLAFGVLLWASMRRGSGGRSGGLLEDIGLRRGVARGCVIGLVISLPMLLLGAVTGGVTFTGAMVRIVGTGPFVEEWFFRGVLVLALVRLVGGRFWPTAIAGGVLFGLVHVQWTAAGFAQGWPHMLFTTAGGIWYAWLAREWGRNLWVVVVAHASMNLSSPWYGADNGMSLAIGTGATIVLGTVMTIRPAWLGMGWARSLRR